ncbi:MAG: hypothetical protein ACM31L_11620 [Actinomycetota bacterium]
MPLLQQVLYHLPAWALCVAILAVYNGAAIAAVRLVRRFYTHEMCRKHNDVGGFIFATVGVIYGVLLGFAVFNTWLNFDKAQDVAGNEAKGIASLYRHTEPFPAEVRERVRLQLADYARAIVDDEWPRMATGGASPAVSDARTRLWSTFAAIAPASKTQEVFLNDAVQKLNLVGELREQRLFFAASGIHPVLYFAIGTGGLITIAFCALFGTENARAHLVMMALLASMIAITIFIIVIMDYPFTGDIIIHPDAFTEAVEALQHP